MYKKVRSSTIKVTTIRTLMISVKYTDGSMKIVLVSLYFWEIGYLKCDLFHSSIRKS